jgi:hypothetical protein
LSQADAWPRSPATKESHDSIWIESLVTAAERVDALPGDFVRGPACTCRLDGIPLVERVKATVAKAALTDQCGCIASAMLVASRCVGVS